MGIDIQLWSSSTLGQSPIDHNTKLHFLSLVYVPSVPLYLAAGPSLDVSTDDDSTATWLSQSLLGDRGQDHQGDVSLEPWWTSLEKQSEQGILLKVEGEGADCGSDKGITELLLYAAVRRDSAAVPTPPASSSPVHDGDDLSQGEEWPEVSVYALPLSSRIIGQASNAMPVTPPSGQTANPPPAVFLPYCCEQPQAASKTHEKRQSLSSLFDDATQKRRKLKGRGGERVAQAMASLDRPTTRHGAVAESRNESGRGSHIAAQSNIARKGLSRAATMPSNPGPEYARHASRSGAMANSKRYSLHRVESAISPRDSPAFSDTDDSFGLQNRTALTKIVLAGMRLYGLQQMRKTGKGAASEGPSTVGASNAAPMVEKEGDDEYKLVYHQTFKAATFTFRRQLSYQVIPQETMRDVVDRFLTLFCTNPMISSSFPSDVALPGFGTQCSEGNGAFDLPSCKALSPSAPTTWSSPAIKKG